ncbi:MAG: Ig-like domain-containing protein [Bacteroidales bacterium]|jgi:hypothetical protein|nr:Ig-like domain-containing protein [Bacteroidales bacterium]MCI1785642.1 Ig-like domain-containing protein [Bacteroidales bacterium]
MKIRNIILCILAIVSLTFLSSCKNDDDSFVASTGVGLTQTALTMMTGDVKELTATILPENATSKYMKWTSSDSKVASVDNFGKVSALTVGKTTITVTTVSGKFTATCEVTVNPCPVQSVSLDQTAVSIYEQDVVTLIPSVLPETATDKTVTWSSSDTDVATVDDSGKVTGKSEGTATITVTTNSGSKTAECLVTVKVRIPTTIETLDFWKDDKAGYRAILGGDEAKNGKWLTYADGVVRWPANTTGFPRTETMEFSTGSKITVTQLAPADFKGSYSLTSKIFSNNSFIAAGSPGTNDQITIGDPVLGETLKDVDGSTYTNQIGVKGLYYTAVMDATVDINYQEKTARVGMFLDARNNAQAVSNGVSGYNYACFLPGMGSGSGTTWASPWNFVQPELGEDQDYTWLWFDVSSDLSKFTYDPNVKMQALNTDLATSAKQICAITVAVSKSANVDAANVRTSWDVVYQGNKYTASSGIVFTRK